jgi:diacylglycerol kinase
MPPEPPSGELLEVPDFPSGDFLEEVPLPHWSPRADRRTTSEKVSAGLAGIKYAIRGDSSFFAHAYRGIFIAATAAILGVAPWGWCFLVLGGTLVLIAELAYSAIDALARSLGDTQDPGIQAACQIATAGVLVASVASGAVTTTVLTITLGVQLGWWR